MLAVVWSDDKLDGVSALYVMNCRHPEQSILYSRGNGTHGQDISFLLPYLQLPSVTTFSELSILSNYSCSRRINYIETTI